MMVIHKEGAAGAASSRKFSLRWWDQALVIRPDWINRRLDSMDSVGARVFARVTVLFIVPALIVALVFTLASVVGSGKAGAAVPPVQTTSSIPDPSKLDQSQRALPALPAAEVAQGTRNYRNFTAGKLGKSAGFRPKRAWKHPTVARDIISEKIDRYLANHRNAQRMQSFSAKDLRRLGYAQPRRLANCNNGACYYDYLRDHATCSQWKSTHFGDGAVPNACHPGANDWGSKNLSALTLQQNLRVLGCGASFVVAIYGAGTTVMLIASVTATASWCSLAWMAS